MPVHHINEEEAVRAHEALHRCCGAGRWCAEMVARRPFAGVESLMSAAEEIWWSLGPDDWREAFTHHPKIGDIDALRKKYAETRNWTEAEQLGCQDAEEAVLRGLAEGNRQYEQKFGYIFIVCATGKSAAEMLSILRERLANEPDTEMRIAAGEQAKITKLRLEKLCQEVPSQPTC